MSIFISKKQLVEPLYEFVERKGIGHPDTLSDALAEYLSVQYSLYTRKNFGAVLHHNFDKVGLLGGASSVTFGKGVLTKPIRVLLNGRASTRFGEKEIPLKALLIGWSEEFLHTRFPMLDLKKQLEFHYNLSNQSSPGKTEEKNAKKGTRKYWFEPRSLDDLQELTHLVSNDTSLGVGYAPSSVLEKVVLRIETLLNGEAFHKKHPWIGSDIKIMGFRHKKEFDITLCVPQIANEVKDAEAYKRNLQEVQRQIDIILKKEGIRSAAVHLNTRDNFETSELYLTAIGSSIESGDEGLVGRGNRVNGVISPMRPMSMEGACGKNPVYHIGKVYYVAASFISEKIYKKFNVPNEVALVSQSGRDLCDPWVTFVAVPPSFREMDALKAFVEKELKQIPHMTERLLQQQVRLY